MTSLTAYCGLFLSALVAATLVPAGSEAALAALLVTGEFSTPGLLLAASLGNVLGATVNYALGRMAGRFRGRRWFPASEAGLARAERWYRRTGRWSLLLSWLPIVGDPITVAAGLLREPVWSFLALVAIAKTGRYLVLVAAFA
ncbi:YqaA family protein [Jannaschia ovalis]|uniref:DedA family protein n=1 Tax=Jannaschia ovalis TaxID=3038773 RepID=A0ABY8LFP7_9RHOB|nr:YqaA family protein [Jannaschia sp. GRR-S6-38]WGH80124.1 DedA family protein [Jannaschia sp. GRR-S6-38]